MYCWHQVSTRTNGMLMAGSYRDSIRKGNIIAFDKNGNLLWNRQVNSSAHTEFIKLERVVELSDGSIVAAGTEGRADSGLNKLILLKFSSGGVVIWQRSLGILPVYGNNNIYISDITEGVSGDILVSCNISSPDLNFQAGILRLNNQGFLVWQKLFIADSADSHFEIAGIHISSGVVITGHFNTSTPACSNSEYARGFFIGKLDYLTGEAIQWNSFCFSSPPASPVYIVNVYRFNSVKLNNNCFVLSGSLGEEHPLPPLNKRRFITARFGENLGLLSCRIIGSELYPGNMNRIYCRPNGDIVVTMPKENRIYTASIDSFSTIKQQKRLLGPGNLYGEAGYGSTNFSKPISSGNENSTRIVSAYRKAGTPVIELFQYNDFEDSDSLCMGSEDSFLSVHQFELIPSSWTYSETKNDFFVNTTSSLSFSSTTLIEEDFCERISICNSLEIFGPKQICGAGQEVFYTARKGAGCRKKIAWSFDTSVFASIRQVNDSTVALISRSFSSHSLSGKIYATVSGCSLIVDSIQVQLLPALGVKAEKKQLCPGDSSKISAGSWFKNYLWQDGSTDSCLWAKLPGKYYVKVETFCGEFLSDTVIIDGPKNTLRLRGDTIACNNKGTLIAAGDGFTNYHWSSKENFIQLNDSTIKAFPALSALYKIEASAFPGCVLSDSIFVYARHSPPISLPPDTSICSNQHIRLEVDSQFLSYNWSTGDTTRTLIVDKNGMYWVKALFPSGCYSTDTFNLLQVYPTPIARLPGKTVLCYRQTDMIDPGSFKSYLWDNASTGRYRQITKPGSYWLMVTDSLGCTARDTFIVNRIVEPPVAFLPADTSVCAYQELDIKARGIFESYKWDDGSTSLHRIIKEPGVYRLEVIDKNGCYGIDSIVVEQKKCLTQILFPNSFSPDLNGRNDIFRPIVKGRLIEYKIEIFNRWGQRVYSSGNTAEGWNGMFNGHAQVAGTYIWKCRYQFVGEPQAITSGTLLLVR